MSERPEYPFEYRGQALSLGQLRLLLADACDMGSEPLTTITEGAIFLREDRRHVMFGVRRRPDGVAVVDPDWAEN